MNLCPSPTPYLYSHPRPTLPLYSPPPQAVHGADPELASLALVSLMEVVRETASYAEFTGLGEACSEWRVLAKPLLEGAVGEVAGDQPCSVLGRGSAKVLQVTLRV